MDSFRAVKSAMRSGSGGHCIDQPPPCEADPFLELENALYEKLQVNDDDLETSSDSPSDGTSSLEDENTSNPITNMDGSTSISSECLHKCAAFSVPSCSEGTEHAVSQSLSMPTDRKLVSAMKGSREKEGVPKKKLSVTWAPDVYDPPPTSVSHYRKKKDHKQYSKSSKKHGKGKHKGKSVQGGGSASKERKHSRKSKTGGRSDRSLNSFADTDRLQNYKSPLEFLDFNDPGIGSPDPNCGSNFLGQASGTMHCVF
ncbi:uncharacterized protein LOC141616794 [Silene latifolia]|uniref:uncharacterized protein LOC141616794 n=1 Tax=Silene latifolia TaxID=37657 RepID=UPI003D776060